MRFLGSSASLCVLGVKILNAVDAEDRRGFQKSREPSPRAIPGPSTLYHNRMVRVIVFSRLLGRKRRAGDAGHRQAALTPAKRREKRPFGRPWAVIGRRRAALVMRRITSNRAPRSLSE